MHEVFIWTAFRHVSEKEHFQQHYADYVAEIWNNLSRGTQQCIVRDVEDMVRNPHWYQDGAIENWRFILNLPINEDAIGENRVNSNEMFILFAVKYAAGRMTYVVSWIVDELRKLWTELQYETKLDIQNYLAIRVHKEGALGMDCDKRQWMEVLGWKLEGAIYDTQAIS